MATHINIYGPPASGKTRYAEEFMHHYRCKTLLDIPNADHVEAKGRGPFLILSHKPILARDIRNVPVNVAKIAIGKAV